MKTKATRNHNIVELRRANPRVWTFRALARKYRLNVKTVWLICHREKKNPA